MPLFFWLTKSVGDRRRRVSRSTQETLAAMSAFSEETLSVSGVLLAKVLGNQLRDVYNEQFEGGRVQWCCDGGDVMADGTVRARVTQPA